MMRDVTVIWLITICVLAAFPILNPWLMCLEIAKKVQSCGKSSSLRITGASFLAWVLSSGWQGIDFLLIMVQVSGIGPSCLGLF